MLDVETKLQDDMLILHEKWNNILVKASLVSTNIGSKDTFSTNQMHSCKDEARIVLLHSRLHHWWSVTSLMVCYIIDGLLHRISALRDICNLLEF